MFEIPLFSTAKFFSHDPSFEIPLFHTAGGTAIFVTVPPGGSGPAVKLPPESPGGSGARGGAKFLDFSLIVRPIKLILASNSSNS